ncbi:unnamed protein product [Caenorhabditis sp. 36 PRJEB53466]|nr:unnamed protein product [Caenorhabditis sp. 36 PRJEB53466]
MLYIVALLPALVYASCPASACSKCANGDVFPSDNDFYRIVLNTVYPYFAAIPEYKRYQAYCGNLWASSSKYNATSGECDWNFQCTWTNTNLFGVVLLNATNNIVDYYVVPSIQETACTISSRRWACSAVRKPVRSPPKTM